MNYKNLLYVLILILASIPVAFSQNRVQELTIRSGCNYYGEPVDSKIYTFDSDTEAIAAVDRILAPTGLVRNFDIRAADVPNARAVIISGDSRRYILYSQEFMRRVKTITKTDWAAISIMAHEIGHHLNGHTLIPGGSRPPTELEADSFSGFVLYKMGATLENAQAAMNAFASESGSSTHPPKRSRLAAIESGWTKAKDQDRATTRQPSYPRTMPSTTRSSTELKLGTYRATAQQLLEGYMTKSTVTLKIKIENIDKSGNVAATVILNGKFQGTLSGTIDDKGSLQLEGFIIRTKNHMSPKSKFSLKATVKNDTLINGKYLDLDAANWWRVTGTFSIAKWGGDFFTF